MLPYLECLESKMERYNNFNVHVCSNNSANEITKGLIINAQKLVKKFIAVIFIV